MSASSACRSNAVYRLPPLHRETRVNVNLACTERHDGSRRSKLEGRLASFAESFEPVLHQALPLAGSIPAKLREAMEYASFGGGKYLRPFIVHAASQLFGVAGTSSLRVGAAVEAVHAYSLVHDDLPAMDNDDMRRGRPTCHIAFGEATALLAGNGLLTMAFEILASPETHESSEVRLDLILSLADAAGARGMLGGQMLDMEYETRPAGPNAAEAVARGKTGALFAFCAGAGAILGQAQAAERRQLEDFGFDLGLAFQIVDDLLDAVGDEAVMGKRTGKDQQASKASFVALYGIDGARERLAKSHASALEKLTCYGPRAEEMRQIAGFVVDRNR